MKDVIVIGAGVIGAATSLRLAESGVDVVLIDAAAPGAGTSSTSFAWVGASPLGLWTYFDLNVAGMAAYRRLRSELGAIRWYTSSGSLVWYSDSVAGAALAERVRELRDVGYSATLIEAAEASRLEPDVRFAATVEQVASYPDEGYAFPGPMIANLVALARERGLATQWGARVVGIDEGEDRVAVRLASGERLEARSVAICGGRWTGEIARLAGAEIPMLAANEPGDLPIGLLVLTRPGLHGIRRLLLADDLMIRPDGAGRLLLHSDEHDRKIDPASAGERHDEIASEVVDAASRHLNVAAAPAAAHAFVGIRALTVDLLPAVGWLPGSGRIYAAVTHSGITLAPILGELIAAEIAAGADEPLLRPFRPSRFAIGELAPAVDQLPASDFDNPDGEVPK